MLKEFHKIMSFDFGDFAADDNDPGELRTDEYSWKDTVIFLVDYSAVKHRSNILKVISDAMRTKIINSPTDLVGVCFYNCDKTDNVNAFEHIYVWQDLQLPDAVTISKLQSFADHPTLLQDEFGSCANSGLYKALWVCSSMFGTLKSKHVHKRVFLFTENDNPDEESPSVQTQSRGKIEDLKELGVELTPFPLGKSFDMSKFYSPALDLSQGSEELRAETLEELTEMMKKQQLRKRALMTCLFRIGDNNVGIRVFNLINKARKSVPVRLDAKTNQPVSVESKQICEYSGQILDDEDIIRYHPYGDVNVVLDADDIVTIKTVNIGPKVSSAVIENADPGITLLGFKPRSAIPDWANLRESYFVCPDEQSVKGSTSLFVALIQELVSQDRVAMCAFTSRSRASIPRLSVLIPQIEEFDDDNYLVKSTGFNMVVLPYTDDIRQLPIPYMPRPESNLVDKAKEIIQDLELQDACPDRFADPALQQHFAALQALALDENKAPHIEDTLVPNPEAMQSCVPLVKDFVKQVYGECHSFEQYSGSKRPASEKNIASKKPKDMATLARKDELESLTVSDLKSFLKSEGIPCGGAKTTLLARVKAHFDD